MKHTLQTIDITSGDVLVRLNLMCGIKLVILEAKTKLTGLGSDKQSFVTRTTCISSLFTHTSQQTIAVSTHSNVSSNTPTRVCARVYRPRAPRPQQIRFTVTRLL
jgi:hypothetical protein